MREQETAFVGKVTAGVSHEFMNVLAIINERSGLIEDLLALDDTSFPYREKLSKTLATIREQVKRGIEISERLNRFAHSMDESTVVIKIDEFLHQIAFLMQRSANLKKIELKVSPTEATVTLRTDPFRLQMVLSACLEYCLNCTADRGVMKLHGYQKEGNVVIRCESGPTAKNKDADGFQNLQEKLKESLDNLGANVFFLNTKDGLGLEIAVAENT
jgi:C4-dicarboxylate-specific signal transduction histidine kinase